MFSIPFSHFLCKCIVKLSVQEIKQLCASQLNNNCCVVIPQFCLTITSEVNVDISNSSVQFQRSLCLYTQRMRFNGYMLAREIKMLLMQSQLDYQMGFTNTSEVNVNVASGFVLFSMANVSLHCFFQRFNIYKLGG